MLEQHDNAKLGRRIRQRWQKNTLREVYLGTDGRVTKRFWVRPGAWRYPKPWLREHAALERLGGDGFPRSYGIRERSFERGTEILFVRDFVEGRPLDRVFVEDARQIGGLLARMHRAGVVMNDAAMDNFVKDDADRIHCIDFGCARLFRRCTPCLFYAAGKELNKLYRKTFSEDPACWYAFVQSYFPERNANFLTRCVTWLGYGVSRGTRWLRKDLMGARRRMRRYERRYGIPKCREKAFEHGAMIVQPTLDCRGALENYISNLDFLDIPDSARLETHNKRYRVYSFFLPAAQRDVMLKVSWANPAYGFWRRLNIRLLQYFKNYGKVAFLGVLALDRMGIQTVTPLAC